MTDKPEQDYDLLCWLVAERDRHEQLYANHRGELMAEAYHSVNARMCKEAAERIQSLSSINHSVLGTMRYLLVQAKANHAGFNHVVAQNVEKVIKLLERGANDRTN